MSPSANLNRSMCDSIRRAIHIAATLLLSATCLSAEEQPTQTKSESSEDAKHRHRANRLARESSPYLLLHAHNPVDWFPWGEEALAKAKREKKLIFLSIGYSSCHWCHVMERESFMDKEIAAFLNEHFVCIKVDREERPDVDSIYMTSLQVFHQLIGSRRGGGWPLSMFLLPDTTPFFGGTYFPARDGDRGRTTGFLTILKRVHQVWKEKPESLKTDGETIARYTKLELEGQAAGEPIELNEEFVQTPLKELKEQFDPKYGGFGFDENNPLRPKFPEPSNLEYLLHRAEHDDDADALKMLEFSLERMAMGGIYDHLGGGFHRYSVDRYWKIPHFEKMLYDNGQLASVYVEAYRLTGREDFRRVVDQLLGFVSREMVDPAGGFWSALDAESEGVEGKYYRWERPEIQATLSKDEYALFASVYGIDGEPNFEEHFYAPQLAQSWNELADEHGLSEPVLQARLLPMRAKLLAERNKRRRPLTDTKVLTSWNGLMIRGFADAGRVLKHKPYIDQASRAADFILGKLRDDQGRLLRTYGEGKAKLRAYVDDYAFLIDGLLALYKASDERKWLTVADELMQIQLDSFWDEKRGGFYFTASDHEVLLARTKDVIDGAIPSGASVSAHNLVRLSRLLASPEYLERAEETIQSASRAFGRSSTAAPRMVVAAAELMSARRATKQPSKKE